MDTKSEKLGRAERDMSDDDLARYWMDVKRGLEREGIECAWRSKDVSDLTGRTYRNQKADKGISWEKTSEQEITGIPPAVCSPIAMAISAIDKFLAACKISSYSNFCK